MFERKIEILKLPSANTALEPLDLLVSPYLQTCYSHLGPAATQSLSLSNHNPFFRGQKETSYQWNSTRLHGWRRVKTEFGNGPKFTKVTEVLVLYLAAAPTHDAQWLQARLWKWSQSDPPSFDLQERLASTRPDSVASSSRHISRTDSMSHWQSRDIALALASVPLRSMMSWNWHNWQLNWSQF